MRMPRMSLIRRGGIVAAVLLGTALLGLARAPVSAQYRPFPFSISGPIAATAGTTATYVVHFDTENDAGGGRGLALIWDGDAEYVGSILVSGKGRVELAGPQPVWLVVGPGVGDLEIQIRIAAGATGELALYVYEPGTETSGTGRLHTSILQAGAVVPATTAVSTSTPALSSNRASIPVAPRPPVTGNSGQRHESDPGLALAGVLVAAALAFGTRCLHRGQER